MRWESPRSLSFSLETWLLSRYQSVSDNAKFGALEMKFMIAAAALLIAASAHAGCIVADPSPTPLNVRTAPNGAIIGTLENGQAVTIIDNAIDERARLEWTPKLRHG